MLTPDTFDQTTQIHGGEPPTYMVGQVGGPGGRDPCPARPPGLPAWVPHRAFGFRTMYFNQKYQVIHFTSIKLGSNQFQGMYGYAHTDTTQESKMNSWSMRTHTDAAE